MNGVVVAVADRAQQVLDEDYEELLERLRVADFLYTEYSLEEVIYQLAKVMFSQSLNRGQHDMQIINTMYSVSSKERSESRHNRTPRNISSTFIKLPLFPA
jgi:hypothetical protein